MAWYGICTMLQRSCMQNCILLPTIAKLNCMLESCQKLVLLIIVFALYDDFISTIHISVCAQDRH